MSLMQMKMIVGDSRIGIYLVNDGSVAIVPDYGFTKLYEHCPEGVSSMFDTEGFTLYETLDETGQDYEYGTNYVLDEMPLLKQWLTQMNTTD